MYHSLNLRLQILSIVTAVLFIFLIIRLVKKRKLKENFAILWIIFSIVIAIIVLNFNLMYKLSKFLGVENPNNTVFFFAIIFLVLVLIIQSIELSYLNSQTKNLLQELSILKYELKKNKRKNK